MKLNITFTHLFLWYIFFYGSSELAFPDIAQHFPDERALRDRSKQPGSWRNLNQELAWARRDPFINKESFRPEPPDLNVLIFICSHLSLLRVENVDAQAHKRQKHSAHSDKFLILTFPLSARRWQVWVSALCMGSAGVEVSRRTSQAGRDGRAKCL